MDYRKFVVTDEGLARNIDIRAMRGDSSKARKTLGWQPSVDFRGLVRLLVDVHMRTAG